jgi:hypothetical protein
MGASVNQSQARHRVAAGRSGRLRVVAIAVPLGVAIAGGLGSTVERRSLLLAGATLLGWSQLVGP